MPEDSTQAPPTPAPYSLAGWRAMPPAARRLILMRFLRSIAQGALAVDFVLYLQDLNWTATAIGGLMTLSGLVGAALMVVAGPLSDRTGRRPFLILYEILSVAGAVLVVSYPAGWAIAAAAILLGYGRGANGSAGPFGPVEQAWLALTTPRSQSGRVFSMNGAAGFWGMAIGSFLAGLVPRWSSLLPGPDAHLPLIALAGVTAVINLWQIFSLKEERPRQARAERPSTSAAREAEKGVRRRENRSLALLALVNSVNSIGIGLVGPLLPYWFSVRFGAGPAEIGPVYALAFVLTGISSIVTGEVATRVGLVRAVVWVRLVGVALLAVLPFMPTYALAATLYVLRSVLNRGSAGARQAFGVGLVGDQRRGLASSINALSFRLPSAIGPAATGWMMSLGMLNLPIYVAAAFGLAYVLLFGAVFGKQENA